MIKKVAQLLFVPSIGAGHQASTIEFTRRLLDRDPRLSITIISIQSPFDPRATNNSKTASDDSSIQFVNLPILERLPPLEYLKHAGEKYLSELIASYIPHVRDVISKAADSSVPVAGLVLDLFCSEMVELAKEFGLSCYMFFTSGVAFLALMDYLPEHYDKTGHHFSPTDPDTIIPGYKKPFPATVIPPFLHRENGFVNFSEHAKRIRGTTGVMVNSVAELEPYPVHSLSDRKFPPVYTVGPVLDLTGQAHSHNSNRAQHDHIMGWLDAQPKSSVVCLCFGSMGSMREAQVREVGSGLLKSGARFLWAVKKPGGFGLPADYAEEELKAILPAEFWAAVESGQGVVCKWAPQVEVLAHEAVVGFVSHCGWNSILEALWFGRPIVTWPMYAEQNFNAFQLVEEMGLGINLRLSYDREGDDLVTGDELENAIRRLMIPGNHVAIKAREAGETSRKALLEGGSSYESVGRFIKDIMEPFVQTAVYLENGKQ
ncbi:UDP-glycosyltransferase 71K2-like protein [Drosera capensis]